MTVRNSVFASLLFAIPVLAAPVLMAQTAQVAGVVLDENGSAVPSAKVAFEGSGGSIRVGTDQGGVYRAELKPGSYRVTSSKAGFCTLKRPALRVADVARIRLDLRLRVCATENLIHMKDGKYVGESDSVVEPDKSETLEISAPGGENNEVMIHFCTRAQSGHRITYGACPQTDKRKIQVSVFFNLTTIYANELTFDTEGSELTLRGDISIFEGTLKATSQDEICGRFIHGRFDFRRGGTK